MSRQSRLIILVWFGIVCGLVAVAFRLGATEWLPSFDHANIWLRTWDVGTEHTPLVGPYSRFGWEHPGPALYYALAAPLRAMSGEPWALLLGSFAIAAASVGLLVAITGVRLGAACSVVIATALVTLCFGLGGRLIEPWNPYVLVCPFAFFVGCVWLWSVGVDAALAGATVAGSFAVQCHIGVAPVVLSVFLAGVVVRSVYCNRASLWKPHTAVAIALGLIMWAPPLWDEVARSSNLSALVEFFLRSDSGGPPVGLVRAVGITAAQLSPWGAWLGRQKLGILNDPLPIHEAWLVVPFGLAAITFFLGRKWKDVPAQSLAAILVVAYLACLYSYANIRGVPSEYIAIWPRVLGMYGVCAPVVLLARRLVHPGRRYLISHVSAASVGLLCVAAGVAGLPDEWASNIYRRLAPGALRAVPPHTEVRVVGAGDAFTVSAVALAVILARADRLPRMQAIHKRGPGSHWTIANEKRVRTLVVATGPAIGNMRRRPGSRELQHIDPLSRAQRNRVEALRSRLAGQLRALGREGLIPALAPANPHLALMLPPEIDRKVVSSYLEMASGPERLAYSLFAFPAGAWPPPLPIPRK